MIHDISSIMKDVIKSQKPFEKIDELDVNENLKAFLRRKIIEDVYGVSIPAISSTVTDFADNEEYSIMKPIGSIEKPIGYLGRVRIKIEEKLLEPHLLATWNLARYVIDIYNAVKVIGAQYINATFREMPSNLSKTAILEKIIPEVKETSVTMELHINLKGLDTELVNVFGLQERPVLKIYNEIVLSEIYSLLDIPAILASSSFIEEISFIIEKNQSPQIRINVVNYLTQPSRNPFTDEVLRLFQVKNLEDLSIIMSTYSLLALLSLLIRDKIVLT